jgi:hypothetical protein
MGLSILSFLIIFFSNPGSLFENFSTDLSEDEIKSIEEVNKI